MYRTYHLKYFISVFLLITTIVYAQQIDTQNLKERVNKNRELFFTDPEAAFLNTEVLLEESIKRKYFDVELSLLEHRCWYYCQNSDVDNLFRTAHLLREKSEKYNNRLWEANAYNYLSAAYEINQLYDKSIEEFNKSIAILEKENGENPDIISAKTNAYLSLAKIYLIQEKPKKATPYLLLVIKENEKINDSVRKQRALYMNYANLAACYLKIDSDSSEYYARQSISLKPKEASVNDPITFLNYAVLGDIRLYKKKYEEALFYYHLGEKILPENKSNLGNQKELFRGFYEAYQGLGDTISADLYRLKLKETELEISENRNKSLLKIVEEKPKDKSNYLQIILLGSFLIIVVLVLIFIIKKKNKSLQEQEKKSQEYLNEHQRDFLKNNDNDVTYKSLVEMIKSNDSSFLTIFLEKFPDFPEKLQAISPKIVQTEIEFCALLKLNIPTKEIAQHKNIEPRTVQNKKYLIRKKLNIPKDSDIYLWFSKL